MTFWGVEANSVHTSVIFQIALFCGLQSTGRTMYFQKDASGCKQTQRVYGNLTHDARGQLSCHCTTEYGSSGHTKPIDLTSFKRTNWTGDFLSLKKSHLFLRYLARKP